MRLRLVLAAALATALVLAAAAAASPFTTLYNEYRASGRIDPCKHSSQELEQARREVPPDIDQYAPDFPAALDAALQSRAQGTCAKGQAAASPAPASPAAPAQPPAGPGAPGVPAAAATPNPAARGAAVVAPPVRNASSPRGGDGTPSLPVVLLGAMLLALALAAAASSIAAAGGLEPAWLASARHATAEAVQRGAATVEDFFDWVRLGR